MRRCDPTRSRQRVAHPLPTTVRAEEQGRGAIRGRRPGQTARAIGNTGCVRVRAWSGEGAWAGRPTASLARMGCGLRARGGAAHLGAVLFDTFSDKKSLVKNNLVKRNLHFLPTLLRSASPAASRITGFGKSPSQAGAARHRLPSHQKIPRRVLHAPTLGTSYSTALNGHYDTVMSCSLAVPCACRDTYTIQGLIAEQQSIGHHASPLLRGPLNLHLS
jgi:hypothetical protein